LVTAVVRSRPGSVRHKLQVEGGTQAKRPSAMPFRAEPARRTSGLPDGRRPCASNPPTIRGGGPKKAWRGPVACRASATAPHKGTLPFFPAARVPASTVLSFLKRGLVLWRGKIRLGPAKSVLCGLHCPLISRPARQQPRIGCDPDAEFRRAHRQNGFLQSRTR